MSEIRQKILGGINAKKIKRRSVLFICSLMLSFFIIGIGIEFLYSGFINNSQENIVCTMRELLQQQSFNFTLYVEADKSYLEDIAVLIGELGGVDNEESKQNLAELLKEMLANSNFEYLNIIDIKGDVSGLYEETTNISNEVYFKQALTGNTVIGAPKASSIFGEDVFPIATPIYDKNGNVKSVLLAAYTQSTFEKLILPFLDGNGYAYLVKGDGKAMVVPEHEDALLLKKGYNANILTELENVDFFGDKTVKEVAYDIQNGISGEASFALNGEERYMAYMPVGINSWTLFVLVSSDFVAVEVDALNEIAFTGIGIIICGLLAMMMCVVFLFYASLKDRTKYNKELEKIAYYSTLTDMPNLKGFNRLAQKMLEKYPNERFALLKIDVMRFKMINELFDYSVGDEVLENIAQFIKMRGTPKRIYAHVDSDVFLIMNTQEGMEKFLAQRVETEQELCRRIKVLNKYKIEFRYAWYNMERGDKNIEKSLECVNMAHWLARHENKKIVQYDDSFKQIMLRETMLENNMHTAIKNGEFHVYLQAKYSLATEQIVGAEALVRWCDATGTWLAPNEFIPLFERNGFIRELDFYVFEHTCQLIKQRQSEGKMICPISVNFSRLHLAQPDFVAKLSEIVAKIGISPYYLEIEITESTVFENESLLPDIITQLHTAGFALAMDDFGAGYSSLGVLKSLSVDVLKIDKSFFEVNARDEQGKIVLKNVMQMARELKILTVAEGVETKEAVEFLKSIGCDAVQGYYFARPEPSEAFFNRVDQSVLTNQ